ncbi:hypothetical protein DPMN_065610 [Dreissena polymorpha]|uniref:Uncharacterized protein n=1 Tax=Dreissena polymorpha TaxID=45954 RepID=A0A9D3YWA3_DREPO|nr:hypothetical protein DPMN_065610 [Dreissena polymorpha]
MCKSDPQYDFIDHLYGVSSWNISIVNTCYCLHRRHHLLYRPSSWSIFLEYLHREHMLLFTSSSSSVVTAGRGHFSRDYGKDVTLLWESRCVCVIGDRLHGGFMERRQCWNRIMKAFANSLEPDETPQSVASHQDPNSDDILADDKFPSMKRVKETQPFE